MKILTQESNFSLNLGLGERGGEGVEGEGKEREPTKVDRRQLRFLSCKLRSSEWSRVVISSLPQISVDNIHLHLYLVKKYIYRYYRLLQSC